MKAISGWIGVSLIFISLLAQLYLLVTKRESALKNLYYLVCMQLVIVLAGIFWMVYAFLEPTIYWQTGVSNAIVVSFTCIFVVINIKKIFSTKKTMINKKNSL